MAPSTYRNRIRRLLRQFGWHGPPLMASQQQTAVDVERVAVEWLANESRITQLTAIVPEGEFTFSAKDRAVGWRIALEGAWEVCETAWAKTLLGPGDAALDVGANLGWYTVVMGGAVGRGGVVLAFEPDPLNFRLLNQNTVANHVSDWVHALPVALFDQAGCLSFELSDSNYGDHRVRNEQCRIPDSARYRESTRKTVTVNADCLDAVMESEGLSHRPVQFAKIDAQGAEVAILKGGARTLPRVMNMLIEYWPYGIRRAGSDPNELIDILMKQFRGFVCARTDPPGTPFRPIAGLREHAATVSKDMDYLLTR